jgi:hypothetical protein
LRLQSEVQRKEDLAAVLHCLARLACDAGRWSEAAYLFGAEERQREDAQIPAPTHKVDSYPQRLAELEEYLGTEEFGRQREAGRQLTFAQCLDYGLAFH